MTKDEADLELSIMSDGLIDARIALAKGDSKSAFGALEAAMLSYEEVSNFLREAAEIHQ